MAEHFTNDGYGWTCRHCREGTAAADARASQGSARARFFHEGESEEREGVPLSTRALARWRDDGTRRRLYCPLCGVEEEVREGC